MNRAGQSDEVLMGHVARGERDSLALLIRRHSSGLLTYLTRMSGDRHRGEELLQESFLAVWNHRKKYKFPRSFRSWLYAIAGNCCKNSFRRRRPTAVDLNDESLAPPVDREPGPVEAAVSTETVALVAQAVALLPPQQRTVVALRVWNGLSYAEIGEVAACSEATARSHMYHALAALRAHLEPCLADSE